MAEPTSEPSGQAGSNRAWQIAVGVLAVLLVGVVAFIVLRDDDSDEATGTTSTTSDDASSESSVSEPYDMVCEADDLFAAIPADVLAEGAEVVDFGCTPATTGDDADAYAWAALGSPGVESLTVFYAGREADGSATPVVLDWEVLEYGTDVTCEDVVPTEACDMLPGAPRQSDADGSTDTAPSGSSDDSSADATGETRAAVYEMECTASDLSAAVPADVLAEGAQVTTFACTPSSLEGTDSAFAFLRAEAPGAEPVDVLFTAVPVVEPGSPTVVDWQAITWGSAVVCEEHMPTEACDELPDVPRG
jgi:hypothetical protein